MNLTFWAGEFWFLSWSVSPTIMSKHVNFRLTLHIEHPSIPAGSSQNTSARWIRQSGRKTAFRFSYTTFLKRNQRNQRKQDKLKKKMTDPPGRGRSAGPSSSSRGRRWRWSSDSSPPWPPSSPVSETLPGCAGPTLTQDECRGLVPRDQRCIFESSKSCFNAN